MKRGMKSDCVGAVLEKREAAPGHFWMRLECGWKAEAAEPGQFLHLLLPDGPDGLLLRRPYTVYRRRPGELEILFQAVGSGSGALASRRVGDRVRTLGPLGNGFRMPPPDADAYLVGGGVGMASLFLLAERLTALGVSTRVLIGARSAEYLLCLDDLRPLGAAVFTATDDGSAGFHGFVTELLAESVRREKPSNPHVFACGPTAMMAALSAYTAERGIPSQSALENRMGCAMGVCLGCAAPIQREGELQYERVCLEGPVFDSSLVLWDAYRI